MTILADPENGSIRLEGDCSLEDSEILIGLILSGQAVVDWRQCTAVHTAVLQVLIASRAKLIGPAASQFLQRHIEPVLNLLSGTR